MIEIGQMLSIEVPDSDMDDAQLELTERTPHWSDLLDEIQLYHVYPYLEVIDLTRLDFALCNQTIVRRDGEDMPSIRARHLTILGRLTLDGAYIHTSISSVSWCMRKGIAIQDGGDLTQSFIDPHVSTLVQHIYHLDVDKKDMETEVDTHSIPPIELLEYVLDAANIDIDDVVVDFEYEGDDDAKKEMETILMKAAGRGRIDYVALCIEKGAAVNRRTTIRQVTPLLRSICSRETSSQLEILRMLNIAGCDINLPDRLMTPLLYATSISLGLVQFILETFADVDLNTVNEFGESALHIAVSTKNIDIVRELLAAGIEQLIDDAGVTAEELNEDEAIANLFLAF